MTTTTAGPAATAAIATDRLTKRFGTVIAVSELSLEVRPGEIVGFLGPNGAGKTTTIRLLLGFLRPTSGRCTVLGASRARDPGVRGRIGYLPGDFRMDPKMTGAELFAWFGALRGGPNRARVDELVGRLGLDPSRPSIPCPRATGRRSGWSRPSSTTPRCCCWTSPPAAWIRWSSGSSCAWSARRPSAARRCCSPPTCCRRWSGSPPGWPSSGPGGW